MDDLRFGRNRRNQPGGVVDGPPHSQGGVKAIAPTGEAVAEVEGGERLFSVQDTKALEKAAAQVIQMAQEDPVQADEAAKQLGYTVTEMIVKQEQVNPSELPPGDAVDTGEVVSGAEGGVGPYQEQPI